MTDTWRTYQEAGRLLGVKPDTVRHRAKREGWRRQPSNTGRTLVLIPEEATRLPGRDGDTGGSVSSGVIPRAASRVVEARVAALQAALDREREALATEKAERLAERARADRLAGDVAELARALARLAEKDRARRRPLLEWLWSRRA